MKVKKSIFSVEDSKYVLKVEILFDGEGEMYLLKNFPLLHKDFHSFDYENRILIYQKEFTSWEEAENDASEFMKNVEEFKKFLEEKKLEKDMLCLIFDLKERINNMGERINDLKEKLEKEIDFIKSVLIKKKILK